MKNSIQKVLALACILGANTVWAQTATYQCPASLAQGATYLNLIAITSQMNGAPIHAHNLPTTLSSSQNFNVTRLNTAYPGSFECVYGEDQAYYLLFSLANTTQPICTPDNLTHCPWVAGGNTYVCNQSGTSCQVVTP